MLTAAAMDEFDELLLIEDQFRAEGTEMARTMALPERRHEGHRLGLTKGVDLGREVRS